MMILVSALDPLREIIFPEKSWDKRGVQHLELFIQQCKRTIRALIEELDLLEMHKETRAVIDETIDDRFIVDAITSLPQTSEPVPNEIMTPFKSNRT